MPTATTRSPRSTMAGKMKVECARSSITLTGKPTERARASQVVAEPPHIDGKVLIVAGGVELDVADHVGADVIRRRLQVVDCGVVIELPVHLPGRDGVRDLHRRGDVFEGL